MMRDLLPHPLQHFVHDRLGVGFIEAQQAAGGIANLNRVRDGAVRANAPGWARRRGQARGRGMPRPRKPASPFRYFNSSPEVIRLVVLM